MNNIPMGMCNGEKYLMTSIPNQEEEIKGINSGTDKD
jgi:hypothetical protein